MSRVRTRLAAGYFVVSMALLVAPAYTTWGNSIEPRVLGHPWSLAYVLLIVSSNFAVLAFLFARRWIGAGDEGDA